MELARVREVHPGHLAIWKGAATAMSLGGDADELLALAPEQVNRAGSAGMFPLDRLEEVISRAMSAGRELVVVELAEEIDAEGRTIETRRVRICTPNSRK
jgi:hypothetical protein